MFGNIIEILDTTGKAVVKYTYDAWGNHKVFNPDGTENTSTTFIGNINPYRYRGYYFDTETGLYYLQTRYYDPQIGRFVSMDDVAYIDPETIGGTNLFAYCNNNPVMNVDPNGNFFFSFLIAIGIGAIIGFTGTVVSDVVDDGEVFNGSVGWQQYLGNTFIGAGVGATLALGSGAIVAGLKSTGIQLAVDGISSLVTGTNQFGSFQEYALVFATSGIASKISLKFNDPKKWENRFGLISNLTVEPLLNGFIESSPSFSVGRYMVNSIANIVPFLFFSSDFGKTLFSELVSETVMNNLNR